MDADLKSLFAAYDPQINREPFESTLLARVDALKPPLRLGTVMGWLAVPAIAVGIGLTAARPLVWLSAQAEAVLAATNEALAIPMGEGMAYAFTALLIVLYRRRIRAILSL